ncbi:hypothetical protein QQ008_01100 [Fulvivirgaceae bacterium BMA10]|uniref:Uncharacterized protein n=1 Tax=Splendidivirga corallicola TaxID=3051826 RepID=A0ABT8KGT2_9BACT|nr:hypothetical protein [Fulvivirgaceae bacterium BMA10]
MKEKLELIKSLVWPILITLFVLFNWSAIHNSIEHVPELISKSESISIGGLSIKINQNLQDKSSPEIKAFLKEISPADLDLILQLRNTIQRFSKEQYDEYGANEYKGLLNLGLAIKKDTLREANHEVDIVLSKEGESVRNYLIEIINELIKEAK